MRSASPSYSSYEYRPSLCSRALSSFIAVALVGLLLFMLAQLGLLPNLPKKPPGVLSVDLLPGNSDASEQVHKVSKAKVSRHDAAPPTPRPATPPKPKPKTNLPWNVIPLTSAEFSQADIANKPTRAAAAARVSGDGSKGTETAQSSGGTYGPNSGGSSGDEIRDVDWYQKPTHAQLATYMPPGRQTSGWGDIVCRMADHYHVEDCREAGETPGSGLSRTLRQAAWQFLVRPPMIGNRVLIGTYVRIHFDFTVTEPER